MQLANKIKENNVVKIYGMGEVYCKCFEDNAGALELAMVPKLRARTKHINLVYHHFQM